MLMANGAETAMPDTADDALAAWMTHTSVTHTSSVVPTSNCLAESLIDRGVTKVGQIQISLETFPSHLPTYLRTRWILVPTYLRSSLH